MRTCIKRGIFCLLLLAVLTLSAAALRPGDAVGTVLATDIRAFIDGVEIPAYNIDGHLGVVAEDLSAYGFAVEYTDETRTLSQTRTGGETPGVAIPPSSGLPSGTPLMRASSIRSFSFCLKTSISLSTYSSSCSFIFRSFSILRPCIYRSIASGSDACSFR